jgi:hypothetical protein
MKDHVQPTILGNSRAISVIMVDKTMQLAKHKYPLSAIVPLFLNNNGDVSCIYNTLFCCLFSAGRPSFMKAVRDYALKFG